MRARARARACFFHACNRGETHVLPVSHLSPPRSGQNSYSVKRVISLSSYARPRHSDLRHCTQTRAGGALSEERSPDRPRAARSAAACSRQTRPSRQSPPPNPPRSYSWARCPKRSGQMTRRSKSLRPASARSCASCEIPAWWLAAVGLEVAQPLGVADFRSADEPQHRLVIGRVLGKCLAQPFAVVVGEHISSPRCLRSCPRTPGVRCEVRRLALHARGCAAAR